MSWIENASPQALARIGGALYLINIVAGAFAIGVVPAIVIVNGDAVATAHNLVANELVYRLGMAVNLLCCATNIPLAVVFFELFRAANRRLALLIVYFTLVATAVQISLSGSQFAPLMLLSGPPYSNALGDQQLAVLAYQPVIAAASIAYVLSTIFFAFFALVIGAAILGARIFPSFIGVLMLIDGAGYLFYGFADIIAPQFAVHLVPWVQLPILAAEGSLSLWMLIAGVRVQRGPSPPRSEAVA